MVSRGGRTTINGTRSHALKAIQSTKFDATTHNTRRHTTQSDYTQKTKPAATKHKADPLNPTTLCGGVP